MLWSFKINVPPFVYSKLYHEFDSYFCGFDVCHIRFLARDSFWWDIAFGFENINFSFNFFYQVKTLLRWEIDVVFCHFWFIINIYLHVRIKFKPRK